MPVSHCHILQRWKDDIDRVAERFEEAEKGLEEIFARDGTDERRQLRPAGGIDVGVEAVPGLRHDVELPAGADGIGERETAVATPREVGLERRTVGRGDVGDRRGTEAGLGGGEVVVEKAHGGGCRGEVRGWEDRQGLPSAARTNLGHAGPPCAAALPVPTDSPWPGGGRCPPATRPA